jgi:hypothetical protein
MAMPVQISDVAALHDYLAGVVYRADHHADDVRYVVLPLIGAVVLFKDPDSPIQVRTRRGSTANVLWVHIGGTRYAISYEHQSKSIVLKRRTLQGQVVAHFTNTTSVPEILDVFRGLGN